MISKLIDFQVNEIYNMLKSYKVTDISVPDSRMINISNINVVNITTAGYNMNICHPLIRDTELKLQT